MLPAATNFPDRITQLALKCLYQRCHRIRAASNETTAPEVLRYHSQRIIFLCAAYRDRRAVSVATLRSHQLTQTLHLLSYRLTHPRGYPSRHLML